MTQYLQPICVKLIILEVVLLMKKHLCLYVKDVIDDVDGYDGIVFNRWYADMCRKGVQVDWYDCR